MGAAILILLPYLHLDVNSYLPTYRININLIHRVYFLHFFYFLTTHKFVSNKLGYYSPQYYYRSLIIYIRNGRSCLHSVDMENYVWLYGSVNSNYLSEKWIQLLILDNNVRKSASYGFSASGIECTRPYALWHNIISCFTTWIFFFFNFEIAFLKRLQSLIIVGYSLKLFYASHVVALFKWRQLMAILHGKSWAQYAAVCALQYNEARGKIVHSAKQYTRLLTAFFVANCLGTLEVP